MHTSTSPSASQPPHTQSPPHEQRKMLFIIVLSLLLGGTIGFVVKKFTVLFQTDLLTVSLPSPVVPQWLDISVIMLLALCSVFAVIAMHELGHVLGGILAGFRFHLFIVGPLCITRENDRLVWSLNNDVSLYGGIAACIPYELTQNIRRGMMQLALGGPLVSVLFGTGMLVVAAFVIPILQSVQPWGNWMLFFSGLTGASSLLLAVATGIPYRVGGFFSDGARVRMLLRDDATSERYAAVAALAGLQYSNQPFSTVNTQLLTTALSLPDGTLDDITAHIFAYTYSLDNEDWNTAAQHIEYALSHLQNYPPAFQPLIMLEAVFFFALHHNSHEQARQFYAQIPSSTAFIKPYSRLRAEAALAYAERRYDDARTKLQEARVALHNETLRNSAILWEEHMLNILEDRCTSVQ
ncbi:MAG: hypothetical protein RML40_07300 [Bacteroidota bacterium]|nr:hypothetical protein [Candidatus Kapabacteria bacterium]MDW8220323.1 hypothetical protein [Bacteroidota bacterium]